MTTMNAMQIRVQNYLDERRRLGHDLGIAGLRLSAFARFADDVGHKGPLTLQLIVDWAQGQATRATPITWARRLEVIRPFAKFCAQDDPGTAIPSADLFGRGHRRLTPHIYSDDEVVQLLLAAGRLPPAGGLRPATYQNSFRVNRRDRITSLRSLKSALHRFRFRPKQADDQGDEVPEVPACASAPDGNGSARAVSAAT